MTTQEMNARITERANEMMMNPAIVAEYKNHANKKDADQWLFNQSVFTLMYSPEERIELMKKKKN